MRAADTGRIATSLALMVIRLFRPGHAGPGTDHQQAAPATESTEKLRVLSHCNIRTARSSPPPGLREPVRFRPGQAPAPCA